MTHKCRIIYFDTDTRTYDKEQLKTVPWKENCHDQAMLQAEQFNALLPKVWPGFFRVLCMYGNGQPEAPPATQHRCQVWYHHFGTGETKVQETWIYNKHDEMVRQTKDKTRDAKYGKLFLECEDIPAPPMINPEFVPSPDEIVPPPIVTAYQKAVDLENALRSAHFAEQNKSREAALAEVIGHSAWVASTLEGYIKEGNPSGDK